MKRGRFLTTIAIALILASMAPLSTLALPAGKPLPAREAEPSFPEDVPTTLVPQGVTDYDLAEPKLFWHTKPGDCPPPKGAPGQTYFERIARIATYGGITRTLYYQETTCGSSDLRSNIIADDNYLYWMSTSYGGVVRLSTNANVGDPPELLSSAVSGNAELAQDDTYVYALSKMGAGLLRIRKSDGAAYLRVSDPGTSPHSVQADGKYVYWITAGQLKRMVSEGFGVVYTIASGVIGYYPEGRKLLFCIIDPPQCYYTEYVFFGQGNQVVRFNNLDAGSTVIYTSGDSTGRVYSLATHYGGWLGPSHLFFFESREISCDPFCYYNDILFRMDRGGGAADALYQVTTPPTIQQVAGHLKNDYTFLFWDELGALKRLPEDAAALPQINITARGMEITQGIQDIYNSVRLIENKRTFVRVRADTYDTPVAGVTAYLYRTDSGGQVLEGPLVPVNQVGTKITVQPWPSRAKLDDSFLFELPWSWTTGSLYLKAVVNPNGYPLEPNYGDNTVMAGPFAFSPSPRLPVQFVAWRYQIGSDIYSPRYVEDVLQTYSWIRRVYPLASTPGSISDPSPGFRPGVWFVYSPLLGSLVDQSHSVCTLLYPDPDYRNLCASHITNLAMQIMRTESGLPPFLFMYGLISDGGGFPRGQAFSSSYVSSGPAGTRCCKCTVWDKDGACTDWYAGHEIGHTLARDHPVEGASICGHSADDPNYPYPMAKITAGTLFGFDFGDPGINPKLQRAIYPGFLWYDIMTYCDYLWISDYTYEGMYNFMTAYSSQYVPGAPSPRVQGDFLGVYGSVLPDHNTAVIARLRHLSSVAEIPPLVPGPYSIRLLDAGDNVLADYAFTPKQVANADQAMLSFGQVVTLTAGTAQVQIVRLADSYVLASEGLSANPPAVSGVALPGAPDPVTGTVTLAWNASDPDADPLTFDILYSPDGGVTLQTIQTDVSGNSTQIDTSPLGGSSNAILRVVASDGVHTAQGDTAPFTMAGKPPQPYILSPADGTQVHWGQLVNFSGEAFDWQDGSVGGANLVWSNQHGQLGTGPLLSVSDLPVGVNTITLLATNSLGLSASTQITVIVDDDLTWPGPTLSVGPTQVGWHVAAGETQLQIAELSLSNAGTDELDWEASEDAPWLVIGAVSGTVPFTLTLVADPGGLSTGTVLTTTLWFTGSASGHPAQTVAIPVSLMVGDVYRPPSIWHSVYLPLVTRHFQP